MVKIWLCVPKVPSSNPAADSRTEAFLLIQIFLTRCLINTSEALRSETSQRESYSLEAPSNIILRRIEVD